MINADPSISVAKRRARNLRWQRNNRDKVRASNRRWAAENPEKCQERQARWYVKQTNNPNTMKSRTAKTKKWRKENPEKHCAQVCRWQAANQIKVAAVQHARRAREIGAKGKYTKADIDRLFVIQDGKCASAWCRKSIVTEIHIDHVISLARDGSNDPINLQLLCPSCNRRKWAKHPITFAQENGMLL